MYENCGPQTTVFTDYFKVRLIKVQIRLTMKTSETFIGKTCFCRYRVRFGLVSPYVLSVGDLFVTTDYRHYTDKYKSRTKLVTVRTLFYYSYSTNDLFFLSDTTTTSYFRELSVYSETLTNRLCRSYSTRLIDDND